MKGIALISAVGAWLFIGCAKEEPKPKSDGVEIEAPGVKIKVDKKGATEIEAPGTDIKIKP